MKNRERFRNVLNFQSVDRLPIVEWASWWNKTIERWKKEGLPDNLCNASDIRTFLGLDSVIQYGVNSYAGTFREFKKTNNFPVSDIISYKKAREHLFPSEPFDRNEVKKKAVEQSNGNTVVWITLLGFFWFPRTLFGIEKHLYAFYDNPDVMHMMNQDLLEFNLRVTKQFCEI